MEGAVDPATQILRNIANAVAHAVRKGTEEDRKQVRKTVSGMLNDTPAVSEDTAALREFFESLLTVLDGNPVSSEGMSEPYAGIYDRIIQAIAAPAGSGTPADMDEELRQFLTQLSAGTLLVCRSGTDEEKKLMVKRLRDIEKNLVPAAAGAGPFVLALASLVEGDAVEPGSLDEPYSGFLKKLINELGT